MTSTQIFPDVAGVVQAAAEIVIEDLAAAIDIYGNATWVIAGGSTPVAAYKLLAAGAIDALDWSKVTIVIGDERCVPFDSPESNWTQAQVALLDRLALPDRVARPRTDLSADQAAESYEQYLQQLPKTDDGLPRFDHVWLGVGEDGHTLSLFPDHPSSTTETDSLVIAVHNSPKPPPDRISLTLKALQHTPHCVIMATGAGKAAAIAQALAGDESLPVAQAAAAVSRAGGAVTWLLDSAVAGQA